MKVLNNKIYYRLLPDDEQTQKTIFNPNADMIRKMEVLDVGSKVEEVKVGDIISIYVNDMNNIESDKGFCLERSVIFINNIPTKDKVHIRNAIKEPMSVMSKAEVIESNSENIEKDDIIFFKAQNVHQLPDNTEIISESLIYYKK